MLHQFREGYRRQLYNTYNHTVFTSYKDVKRCHPTKFSTEDVERLESEGLSTLRQWPTARPAQTKRWKNCFSKSSKFGQGLFANSSSAFEMA